jgi:PAS domain S-box-containing protein
MTHQQNNSTSESNSNSLDQGAVLNLLLHNTDESFILLNTQLEIIVANREARERSIRLLNKDMTPGRSIFDFAAPDRIEMLKSLYIKILAGEQFETVINIPGENGKLFFYTNFMRPARSTNGNIEGVIITSRDITKEVEAQREKDRSLMVGQIFSTGKSLSKNLYELLAYLCTEFKKDAAEIWVTSIDEKCLHLSSRFQCLDESEKNKRISFKINEGLPGTAWHERRALHIPDLEQAHLFLRKEFAQINNFKSADAIPLFDDDRIQAVIVFFSKSSGNHPMQPDWNKNPEGALPAMATYLSPVLLEHIATEINRKIAEERLNKFFDLSPDVLSIAGVDGFFKKLNPSFPAILGYTMEEMLQKPYYHFIHPDDLLATSVLVEEFAGGLKASYFENRFRHADGSYRWFAWTSTSLEEEGLIFGVAKDVTQKKSQEEALQHLNQQLVKRALELANSNADLEKFAYVASHDLQEPLRMVSSFLQLLEKKYENNIDDTGKQYIRFAVDGAERMKKLILDLLEYSRVGTKPTELKSVMLADIVEDVVSQYQLLVEETKATIDASALKNLPPIMGNPFLLKQLFHNLLGNAIKYRSKEPPVIKISCSEDEDSFVFCVSDNGIGIDPRFAEKVFVIFQRLHNSSAYKGTGIGLAIAKKIVEKHGGKIWVEPNPPQGSSFFFSISKYLHQNLPT